jgi:hypothetical protein
MTGGVKKTDDAFTVSRRADPVSGVRHQVRSKVRKNW